MKSTLQQRTLAHVISSASSSTTTMTPALSSLMAQTKRTISNQHQHLPYHHPLSLNPSFNTTNGSRFIAKKSGISSNTHYQQQCGYKVMKTNNPTPLITSSTRSFFGKKKPLDPEPAPPKHQNPFKRDDSFQRVRNINEIPDDTEEIITKIVSKPAPTKEEISHRITETRTRVDTSVTAYNNLSRSAFLSLGMTSVLMYLVYLQYLGSAHEAFPAEKKLELLPLVTNQLLEPSIHDHINITSGTLNKLIEITFGKSLTELYLDAAEHREKLLLHGALRSWATDEQLGAVFGPSSPLTKGCDVMRIDPYSAVYDEYDAAIPEKDSDDLDKYLLISLEHAEVIMNLYLAILVLHLDNNMTEPIFEYLHSTGQNTSLTEAKDVMWVLLKDTMGVIDRDGAQMLQSESKYEQLKQKGNFNNLSSSSDFFNENVTGSDGGLKAEKVEDQNGDQMLKDKITLRGLRKVIINFHYLAWSYLKDALYNAPLIVYEEAKNAYDSGHFKENKYRDAKKNREKKQLGGGSNPLPDRFDFFSNFAAIFPYEFNRERVLKYPIAMSIGDSYYFTALEDQNKINDGVESTLTAFLDNLSKQNSDRFKLTVFTDDEDDDIVDVYSNAKDIAEGLKQQVKI